MGRIKEMALDFNSPNQAAIDFIENGIRNTDLFLKLDTGSKVGDFEPDDVVQCSYLKGFYKIAGPALYNEKRLAVYPIDYSGEFTNISPEFLKKVKVNDKVLKVLYES
jgi:hypothetical protein